MPFYLLDRESASLGIRRIYQEEIEQILTLLTGQPDGLDEAVHDARTGLKRVRTLIRLVRSEVGYKFYRSFNAYYRETGRLLAPLRDGAVLIKTLNTLIDRFPNALQESMRTDLCALLEADFQTTRHRFLEEDNVITQAIERLETKRFDLPLKRKGFSIFRGGLRRIYRDGRNAMQAAYAADPPDPHLFHEWRKQVKYLWYALTVLEPIWPHLVVPYNTALHELSDYLGDDHDLAVLYNTLNTSDRMKQTPERTQLLSLIRHIQSDLQRQAHPLGYRLYADTPRPFVHRIETYWQIWNRQLDASTGPASKLIET